MQIHPKLLEDSHYICDFNLSQLRIIPDGENPWFLLIPKIEGMVDWSDLSSKKQHQLADEIDHVCKYLKSEFKPDKLNVASLGNMVPQLHIHIIARYKTDRAWPGPIWGTKASNEFSDTFVKTAKDYFN